MTLATVVIPVSPKHRASGIYHEAVQSAQQQTLSPEIITVFDDNGNGAAHTRNKGTAQVKTPFVIWLDADDRLRPTFIEQCLKTYQAGHFVYTDWVVNGLIISTPNCLHPFENGQEHVITTLLPVTAWQSVGGFDKNLSTLEDEDFYRKLASYGWCGIRCAEPLVEYRRHLGASLVNLDTVDKDTQKQRVAAMVALFEQRYGRHEHMADDCGCFTPKKGDPSGILGQKQMNDVLVETLYTPQKVEGAMTRRLYPRAGLGKRLWVHEDDARSRPDLFRIIGHDPVQVSPDVKTVARLANEAIQREQQQPQVQTPDFATMPYNKLMRYAKSQAIAIQGTGKKGAITKGDLIAALS
jgi:hypothetical protein